MASVVTQAGGRRLIQLSPSEHPNRPKIRLGLVTKREAESARVHVEGLLRAKVTGSAYPPATAEWLAGLPVTLRRRLERFGLVEPQGRRERPTLADWLETYIGVRLDVKENTRLLYEQTRRNLLEHFGGTRRLDKITAGDAEEFRLFLHGKGLAEGIIRRRCGRAKQFFAAAAAKEIISRNPFEKVRCGNFTNSERYHFVSEAEIEAVIDACPERRVAGHLRPGPLRRPARAL